jgi:arylsulfatase
MDAPYYPFYAGEKLWAVIPAGCILKIHFETFKEFPPRQATPNFNLGDMVEDVLRTAAYGL